MDFDRFFNDPLSQLGRFLDEFWWILRVSSNSSRLLVLVLFLLLIAWLIDSLLRCSAKQYRHGGGVASGSWILEIFVVMIFLTFPFFDFLS